MVGTPPAVVTRSRSISWKARTGSHLRIITSLPPVARAGFMEAEKPVTWKKGIDTSVTRCGVPSGAGMGGASPRRR